MNILLFGKHGQVGHELQKILPCVGHVTALGSEDVDLKNFFELSQTLHRYKPNLIVNAAAYTAVDKAENDELNAYKVNSEAVEIMAKYADDNNSLFVHYSTDYIFDGQKHEAYLENDSPNPQNIYGRSKLAGEKAILKSGCPAFIFRTSWVVSIYGHNFVKTILKLASDREQINVVSDQYGVPTSAEFIAYITKLAILNFFQKSIEHGIYNLVPNGETNWYQLASYIVERASKKKKDLKLQIKNIFPVCTEEFPLPAKRPKNSRLNNSKLSKALDVDFPDWTIHANRIIDQLIG